MHRLPAVGPRLEALLADRDHLRIKLHLALQRQSPDPEELAALRVELALMEREINKHWKNTNA